MNIIHINCNYILSALHQCLVERLREREITNSVYVATYDKHRGIVDTADYVRVEECFRKWDRLFFDYKQRKIIKRLEKCYCVKNFDLIHAYTLFTDGNTAMKISKKYEIPYIVAIRNTDVNAFFKKRIFLRRRGIKIMRNAEKICFLSESYREQLFLQYVPKKYYSELKEKTMVIPNGIDDFWLQHVPEKLHELPNRDSVIHLIFAGRIDKNKNLSTTIAAMKRLEQAGIATDLTVVGPIEDNDVFRQIQKEKHVHYIEKQPKEKLIALYRQADIFVMPSLTESFGLVYAEAMSQGLPVVYSKGQGFDGQFSEGEVGYHVEATSVESVADGICQVLEHYDTLRRNVVSCAGKFCWQNISQVYAEEYARVMDVFMGNREVSDE